MNIALIELSKYLYFLRGEKLFCLFAGQSVIVTILSGNLIGSILFNPNMVKIFCLEFIFNKDFQTSQN